MSSPAVGIVIPPKKGNGAMGFLRTAFPFIHAALSAGGPLGTLAGNIFGKAIGADKAITNVGDAEGTYATALAAASAPAELIKQAQDAEYAFKDHAAQMGYDSLEKMEALAVADRKDARARQIAVGDHTPQIGFYLLLAAFVAAFIALCMRSVPNENKALVYGMVGTLGALTSMAGNFFYGSTVSSARKTEIIAQSQPVDAQNLQLGS